MLLVRCPKQAPLLPSVVVMIVDPPTVPPKLTAQKQVGHGHDKDEHDKVEHLAQNEMPKIGVVVVHYRLEEILYNFTSFYHL